MILSVETQFIASLYQSMAIGYGNHGSLLERNLSLFFFDASYAIAIATG